MHHSTMLAPKKNSLRFWYFIILFSLLLHVAVIIFIFFKTIINHEIHPEEMQKKEETETIFFIPHAAPSPNTVNPIPDTDDQTNTPQESESSITQEPLEIAPPIQNNEPIYDVAKQEVAKQIASDLFKKSIITNQEQTKALDSPKPIPEKVVEQKKLPSLADLLQGFVQKNTTPQTQSEGLLKSGTEQAAITRKQLVLEQYLSKMGKNIEVSFSSLRSERPNKIMKQPLTISLTIKPTGHLESIVLVKSSGLPDMDQFFVRVFQDAGFSFPPVPSLLLHNGLYYFTVTIDPPNSSHSYGQISIGTLRW